MTPATLPITIPAIDPLPRDDLDDTDEMALCELAASVGVSVCDATELGFWPLAVFVVAESEGFVVQVDGRLGKADPVIAPVPIATPIDEQSTAPLSP